MSPGFLRKAVLTGVFGAAAIGAGRLFMPARGVQASTAPPCVAEFVRDSRETAALLDGTFHYPDRHGDMQWEFKFPPGTSREDIKGTLQNNGYRKFFDPFHEGANYKKVVNGRWYHYIVLNKEPRVEVHWERSEPGTFPHMFDVGLSFVKSTPQPLDAECRRRLPPPQPF